VRINPANWRPNWLPSLHDPGPPRLWRIGYALTACFAAAVIGLIVLGMTAQALLGYPHLTHTKAISLHDTVGVAQLVFASVAGAGALVALVMAYRRQRVTEATTVLDKERAALDEERWQATAMHERTRLLNERFTTVAAQLGDDQAAVRLAGVHAMAGLADDWEDNRQTCIDVLCAYLRMPYEPDPGPSAAATEQLTFHGSREVRHTVIRVITSHLRDNADTRWSDHDFDFTGVVFDGGDFSGALFSGIVKFTGAKFSGGEVSFTEARFSGGEVSFTGAEFSGGEIRFGAARFYEGVSFSNAVFSGGEVSFERAVLPRTKVDFGGAVFSGGEVSFKRAVFSAAEVSFTGTKFSGGEVTFEGALFASNDVGFGNAVFSGGAVGFLSVEFSRGEVSFERAVFSGSEVSFGLAKFSGGEVSFGFAEFSAGEVSFTGAKFSGGKVSFGLATFSGSRVSFLGVWYLGGQIDFSAALDWTYPPRFESDSPPPGVRLPRKALMQSKA
jgi:uncharacterized protein YjbI with pentapeptide repeats